MKPNKLLDLIDILRDLESVLLAFSGGVDSSFLLKAIQLSNIKCLAVTATSEIRTSTDLKGAKKIARELNIKHIVIKTEELSHEDFTKNTPERCFFCKDHLFEKLCKIAKLQGFSAVIDGSTIDDMHDYRPGNKAVQKHKIRSPLIEAGFRKKDVRELSKQIGLSTWNKPSTTCLATRIPYGQEIAKEILKRIEKAENFLQSMGFYNVRVRDYGNIARIEVPEDSIEIISRAYIRKTILNKFKNFGYKYITLDLEGYISGSMNKVLEKTK